MNHRIVSVTPTAALAHELPLNEKTAEGEFAKEPDLDLSAEPRTLAIRRLSFILLAVVAAIALRGSLGRRFANDISLVAPLIAITAAAMCGGWVWGLAATALISSADVFIFHATHPLVPFVMADKDLCLLAAVGVLCSFVGGEVFAARRRARASDAERLDLERKVLEISDDERRRIGHDLHDGLGQHLTGISLLSASLAQRIESGSKHTAADAEKISQLVAQTIGWTRDLARGLSPVTLESDGLLAALEELAHNAETVMGIRCSWRCEGPAPKLDRQSSMHIFRIVQEAVSNSVKHGKAKTVHVSLVVRQNMLTAKVVDDGCGLSAKTKANPGLGLRIMNYRARMVGARLTLARASHAGGTVMACQVPAEVMR